MAEVHLKLDKEYVDENVSGGNLKHRDSFNEQFQIMGDEINPKLKIIHFSNPDNKIDIDYYNWVRKHWHA